MFSLTLFAETMDYKINVIRPRYFVKKNRLELASEAHMVMNETFTYTLMFSAMTAYHLTEYLAFGLDAVLGVNFNKADNKTLRKDYGINIGTSHTRYNLNASIMWSPVYGKYQLSSGRLIYFDTFFSAGGGYSNISIKEPSEDKNNNKDTFIHLDCVAASMGAGQRFYLNKHVSLRWQIRNIIVHIDQADKTCTPGPAENSTMERYLYHTIMFQAGASYFI